MDDFLPSTRERLQLFLSTHPHIAQKSLGQNFLVNDSVVLKMIQTLKDFNPKEVIEIGPGPGALTDHLIQIEGIKLILIELDSHFADVWKSRGAEVIEKDALHWDWSRCQVQPAPVLISNLPYQISASLVIERSMDLLPLSGMILMFQKEVADRLRAPCRTVDYGILSVIAQTFWKIDLLAGLGRADFIPQPKVNSQVLVFKPVPPSIERLRTGAGKIKFLKFIKTCFQQRRKYLKTNLRASYTETQIQEAFENIGLTPQVRAEEIRVAQFQVLFEILSGHGNHSR